MATVPEALAVAVEHHQAGRLAAAEQLYRQILAADANYAPAWHLLGVVQAQLGRHDAGVQCIQRALSLHPDWPAALCNLGRAFYEQRNFADAEASHRRALALDPNYAESYDGLGLALQGQGKLDEAVACHRRAVELRPDYALAHHNFSLALQGQGRLDEAAACYRRALELRPDFAAARGSLLLLMQYCPGVTPAELAAAHAEYDRHHAAPLRATWRPHENGRDPAPHSAWASSLPISASTPWATSWFVAWRISTAESAKPSAIPIGSSRTT